MARKSLKKGLCGILAAASVFAVGASAMAASPEYYFYKGNTGTTYNELSGTANAKTYEQDTWSLKVNTISFSSDKKLNGIAFVPLRGGSVAGRRQWRTSAGASYGNFGDYGYKLTTYKLGARIDSDLEGSGYSKGYWNADYISSWGG